MARQSFNDFLNSPGPSTPRGRGRGRGGGRGGGGRGGPSGGGGGGGRSSFTTDYSNVPLDYTQLSGRKYTKMDGFQVEPFGSNSQTPSTPSNFPPRGRGGYGGGGAAGGGRGRGRGRGGGLGSVPQAATPGSGSRTPVTGLGFHGQGHSFKSTDVPGSGRSAQGGARRRMVLGDTVGKNGVTWGGGAAPLFVKAGELFKDGELDEKPKSVEEVRDSSAAPPFETELHDSTIRTDSPVIPPQAEIRPWSPPRDINDVEDMLDEPSPVASPSANLVDLVAQTETISLSDHVEGDALEARAVIEESTPALADLAAAFREPRLDASQEEVPITTQVDSEGPADPDNVEVDTHVPVHAAAETELDTSTVDKAHEPPEEMIAPAPVMVHAEPEEALNVVADIEMDYGESADSLFFVDTDPTGDVADRPQVVYETFSAAPLGEPPVRSPSPEEEKIVFKRRSYAQPEPIALDIALSSAPIQTALATSSAPALPASLNRRQKKALKKEKRIRNKSKGKKAAKNQKNKRRPQAYEGSDLDWGSDGPPSRLMDIEGGLDSDDSADDEDVLRDYLAGTLLGKQKTTDAGKESDESSDEEDEEVDSDMEADMTRAYDDAAVGGDEKFELDSDEEENPDLEAESDDDSEDSEVDDDDDAENSSDLGDIQFTATRMELEEDTGSDSDSDGDDLFNAKDSWDETEWFIRNMEDALDGTDVSMGDRKARNRLFKTIEEGDFGDDWGLTPVKRNKKGSGIPLELQGQWERDRQKKAEKKRQRDLARLADLLDPYPATHGKKKRKKGKGLSKIEQAKLAHLIPESATRVAELFDIPSDFEEEGMVDPRRTGRMPNLLPGGRGFPALDAGIRSFIADSGKTAYSVPPMDKEGRRKVHMLAECYGLSSKSRGKGKARFTVLTKTLRTGQNVNEEKVSRLVSAATFSGGQFYKALYTKPKSDKKKGSGPGDRGSSARMRDGETVGEGAERIGIENVGHKLLSMMGWTEGDRIGRMEGGLENPIVAVVKNTKMGLGA